MNSKLTADSLKVGDVLKGTYRIVRFLGEGGAGAVYAGEHVGLGNPVAIKTLFGKFVRDEPMRRRFVEEGVIQANLNHPNVVRVFDIVDEPQLCAIIMEYVDGSSLDKFIRNAPERPDIARMTRIFLQILEGMGYAHSQGIVHRDLKPANVLMAGTDAEPQPKIADFGIAKVVSDFTRTETGTAMGTIYYASPEQLTNAKAVDRRADVYSLACTYFEMLTRQLPFTGDSLYGIMRSHVQAPRPDPSLLHPGISRALSTVIRRGMAIDPEHRPATCEAFAAEIRDALTEPAVTGQIAPPLTPAARSTQTGAAAVSPVPGPPLDTPAGRPRATTAPAGATEVTPMRPLPGGEAGAPRATAANRASTTQPRPGRNTQGAATLSTRASLRPDEPPHLATLVVRGAIVGLSLVLLGVIAFAAFRGDEPTPAASDAPAAAPSTPQAQATAPAATTPEATPPATPEATPPAAEPTEAERYEACRTLVTKYVAFDPFGDVPVGQAIQELDQNEESCEQLFLARAGDSYFDRLVAQLNGDQMRILQHELSALRAGDADCAEPQIAATEAQRSLRRIRDAELSDHLMDYELLTLNVRRQFALERHAGLRSRYDACGIPELPADILPAVDKPEDTVVPDPEINPQIVDTRTVPGGVDLMADPNR